MSITKVPERIRWAIDLLDLRPRDHVLEVGCGPGVAVSLACDRLPEGGMIAIDRSATAVERTSARNARHLAAGRLEVQRTDLAAFAGTANSLDTAFAINVNVFWTGRADAECRVLGAVLRPGGVVRLVYEGPGVGARDIAPLVAANLQRHGFATDIDRHVGGRMICLTGHAAT